jgi:hypothetical protein
MKLPRMLKRWMFSKLADGNDRRHELKAFEGHQGFNRGRDSLRPGCLRASQR